MADFIDKLTKAKEKALLLEMRMDPKEDVIAHTEISSYGGRLFVVHGRKNGIRIESIYTDFLVEKIYGDTPSRYVQDRFQNTMINLCGPEYEKRVKEFNRKNRKNNSLDYAAGDFGEEEEYEDEE